MDDPAGRHGALAAPGYDEATPNLVEFHYFRQTADHRILWGGYDAVYRYGGPVGPHLDDHEATFAKLSQHFFTAFPQLEGVRFSHRWGGAIDTCSRFSVFFGQAMGGRVVYALGYTGLGWAPAGSAPGWAWTCSTGGPARRRRCRSCAGDRCRSHLSRCAAPSSS